MASPIDIAPADAPPTPSGPVCTLCGDTALVSWQRRLTDDELAEFNTLEQGRHDERLLLADPDLPPPVMPPLSTGDDCRRAVYACYHHAITQDAAAHTHLSSCTAPNEADLPGCDCTPEPLPEPTPLPEPPALPPGWGPGGS